MSQLIFGDFGVGYSRNTLIVSGVCMDITGGGITALMGPNGSGKSTILKGIMNFPGVYGRGTVTLDSHDLLTMSRTEKARKIAYLPQSPPVPAGLTAMETVLLGRFPHRRSWSGDSEEDISIAREALEMVDALYLADKHVDEMSGGENRLVNLASVLSQNAGVVLLDEPASSLDYGHAVKLWKILKKLAAGGMIVLATTHRIGMSGDAFDNILLLSEGKPVAFGTPEEVLLSSDLLSEVYNTPLRVVRNSAGGGWIVIPGNLL